MPWKLVPFTRQAHLKKHIANHVNMVLGKPYKIASITEGWIGWLGLLLWSSFSTPRESGDPARIEQNSSYILRLRDFKSPGKSFEELDWDFSICIWWNWVQNVYFCLLQQPASVVQWLRCWTGNYESPFSRRRMFGPVVISIQCTLCVVVSAMYFHACL